MAPRAPSRDHRVWAFASAAAPWSWFAARDLGPWADVVAIFLPAVIVPAAVLAVAAIVARRAAASFAAASWLLFAAVAVVGPWSPLGSSAPEPAGAVRVVAANVLGRNHELSSAFDDLIEQRPAALVVSEDDPRLHARLRRAFAHAFSSDDGGRGVGAYTTLPARRLTLPAPLRRFRALRLRVDAPAGPFVLYALHLPRPWPYQTSNFQLPPTEYRRVIDAVAASVRRERLPVVVAGDLNLVDRTSWYRTMTSTLRDAMRASWAGPTSRKWWPLLARIDHVFEPRTWCSSGTHRFVVRGSDHRGIAASIGRCPH